MKKQIIYTKFIPRVFAITLDLFILSIVLFPVMHIVSRYLFIYIFNDFIISNNFNVPYNFNILHAFVMPEFGSYITFANIFIYYSILWIIHIMFLGCYFVGFWKLYSTTPGKMLMRMKVVDASSLEKPSTINLIKRFLCYITAFFGIIMIMFTKRGQALHDKIAGTIVIKS